MRTKAEKDLAKISRRLAKITKRLNVFGAEVASLQMEREILIGIALHLEKTVCTDDKA